MVDTVLYLRRQECVLPHSADVKNSFGSTNEMGVIFEMGTGAGGGGESTRIYAGRPA